MCPLVGGRGAQDIKKCRFAATRRAQQDDEFAFQDFQVDAPQGMHFTGLSIIRLDQLPGRERHFAGIVVDRLGSRGHGLCFYHGRISKMIPKTVRTLPPTTAGLIVSLSAKAASGKTHRGSVEPEGVCDRYVDLLYSKQRQPEPTEGNNGNSQQKKPAKRGSFKALSPANCSVGAANKNMPTVPASIRMKPA